MPPKKTARKTSPGSGVKAKATSTAKLPPKPKPKPSPKPSPKPRPKPRPKPKAAVAPAAPTLQSIVTDALADMKALDIRVIDVRGVTDIADTMVIASGTSDRHVRSVAQRVVEKTKAAGFRPHGVEGQQDSDWVLIDLSDLIVHVMLPRVREFYGLEKLWDLTATRRSAGAEA